MKEKIWSLKCWFIKNNFLSQRCAVHREEHFVIDYLGKIETEFENTLACLSGAQNHEKKMEVENLGTHSLYRFFFPHGYVSLSTPRFSTFQYKK